MGNKLDSSSLFLAQVNQHAESLGGLLSGAAEDQIDRDLIARCIIRTNMLAKSAFLMELSEWQESLEAFESLLKIYRDRRFPWDEKIAQITSEIIEKEDVLVASAGDGDTVHLGGAVSAEELRALSCELSELMECAVDDVTAVPGEATAGDLESVDSNRGQVDHRDATKNETGEHIESVSSGRPLDMCMAELRRHCEALVREFESSDFGAGDDPSPGLNRMHEELFLLDFYACSIARIVESRTGNLAIPAIESLVPIRYALEDFARARCSGTDRHIHLGFSGEDQIVGAWLLRSIQKILQHLIGDIFLRCNEQYLRVDVTVEERNGALFWTLRDNGDNFVTDSRLDRDEYLAFYPGLRETRKVLSELRSLLWVEPDEGREIRFAFTTPVLKKDARFVIWGSGGISVAVSSNQLGSVYPAGKADVENDSHGEKITVDGRNVRVIRLGQVYSGAPTGGDRIAVIGCLEKRIAFYVSGEGRLEDGVWEKDAVPTWPGMERGMVQVGDQRIPLVDADGLLQRYMAIVDVGAEEDVSGGVAEDVSDLSHTQANNEKDADAPPEGIVIDGDVDVLVVEESESQRIMFEEILSEGTLKTKIVDRLEHAIEFLRDGTASVIISDFRMPSMSARALADRLSNEGRDTPVLVITSDRGKSAETLVKRLGVAGYISKPLHTKDVLSRVGEFLGRSSESLSQH